MFKNEVVRYILFQKQEDAENNKSSDQNCVCYLPLIDAIPVCHWQAIIIMRDVKFVYNCDKLVFHFMHPEYSIRGNEHIMIDLIIIMLLFLTN